MDDWTPRYHTFSFFRFATENSQSLQRITGSESLRRTRRGSRKTPTVLCSYTILTQVLVTLKFQRRKKEKQREQCKDIFSTYYSINTVPILCKRRYGDTCVQDSEVRIEVMSFTQYVKIKETFIPSTFFVDRIFFYHWTYKRQFTLWEFKVKSLYSQ